MKATCDDSTQLASTTTTATTLEFDNESPGTNFLKGKLQLTKIGIPAVDEAHERFVAALAERKRGSFKLFTRAEVALHNHAEDFWVIINDVVYDLTKYQQHHPGGDVFLFYAGKDATDEYAAFHEEHVMNSIAKNFAIGCVREPETRDDVLQFRRMRHQIDKQFIAEQKRKPSHALYYIFKVSLALTLLLAAMYLSATASLSAGGWWPITVAVVQTIIAAVLYGTGTQQSAFVGHDCLHNEVFGTRRGNHWLGLLAGNILVGISASWWKWSHNIHHLTTNSFDHDLDITHMPIFAVNSKMVKGKFDNWFSRWLSSKQHYTFIPIILFSRFNLHVQSYLHILNSKRRVELRVWEFISLTLYFVLYGFTIAMMQSNVLRVIFFFISYFVMGSLGFQLTLSHWALPTYEGMHNSTFFRTQIEASQNIITYLWNDWYYGGLNFQIEHHLFPRVPRYHLQQIKKELLEPFCEKLSIVYHDKFFWTAFADLLRHLANEAGAIVQSQNKKE